MSLQSSLSRGVPCLRPSFSLIIRGLHKMRSTPPPIGIGTSNGKVGEITSITCNEMLSLGEIFEQKRYDLFETHPSSFFMDNPLEEEEEDDDDDDKMMKSTTEDATGIDKPVNHPDCFHLPPYCNPFLCGGPPIVLTDPNGLSDTEILMCADEAVKEYNNRGYKDKIELLKVKKAVIHLVSGILYELTFDAKIVDGEGERIQTYQAEVWFKAGRIEKVNFVNHVPDAYGEEAWWEKYRQV